VAVKIRLKRLGKIRSPHYRIVVMDARAKRDGRAIEEIGLYHPKNDPSVIRVNSERAQYWLGVGAQPTEAVVALFKRSGDWQKFSGDTSPSASTRSPSPRTRPPPSTRRWPRATAPPLGGHLQAQPQAKAAAAEPEAPADEPVAGSDDAAEQA